MQTKSKAQDGDEENDYGEEGGEEELPFEDDPELPNFEDDLAGLQEITQSAKECATAAELKAQTQESGEGIDGVYKIAPCDVWDDHGSQPFKFDSPGTSTNASQLEADRAAAEKLHCEINGMPQSGSNSSSASSSGASSSADNPAVGKDKKTLLLDQLAALKETLMQKIRTQLDLICIHVEFL